MKFTELNLHPDLLKGIEDAGFTSLMPVQEETLKHSLEGKDVAVQSQTGSGKTAAFLITIFQHFQDSKSTRSKKALIVTPTRELALQIEEEAKLLGGHLKLTIGCFYGGVGYHQQEKLIKEGVDIIVGTPGRLLDFNGQKKLNFKDIGFLVIDEADRMFDMGFLPDIRKIIRKATSHHSRQTMLFSATLDYETRQLAREFMNNAVSVQIRPEEIAVDRITQVMYHVNSKEKINLILGILKKEQPKNALIFTNMKHDTVEIANHLNYNGFKCLHISGDLTQKKRISVLEKFKSGETPFLVATDVAARGLHIDDLEMIINYDLPGDCENYVHRIGRTARAGKSGKAITLACERYIYNLEAIEAFLTKKIPVEFADDELFLKSKSQGLRFGNRKKTRGDSRKRKPTSAGKKTGSYKKKSLTDDRKRRRSQPDDPKTGKKSGQKVSQKTQKKKVFRPSKATAEERLEYYKKKYNEHFDIQSQ
jgi:ATP-dependent RNA helicase RhlB